MKTSRGRPTFMKSLKKVSTGVGALKRVRPFVSMHSAIKIYKGLIEPHFDHCSAQWDGFTQQLSEQLQKLQNCVIRVIAMILVPNFFLTRLVGIIYRLEGLNKRLISCASALIISPQLISVISLRQEHRITIFATRRKS